MFLSDLRDLTKALTEEKLKNYMTLFSYVFMHIQDELNKRKFAEYMHAEVSITGEFKQVFGDIQNIVTSPVTYFQVLMFEYFNTKNNDEYLKVQDLEELQNLLNETNTYLPDKFEQPSSVFQRIQNKVWSKTTNETKEILKEPNEDTSPSFHSGASCLIC